MSKELEALKQFRNQQQGVNVYADELLDIIETGLKRLEEKEHNLKVEMKVNSGLMKRLAKQNQALEIIKEKGVDVIWLLETKNVEEYNSSLCIYSKLPQEEYDLLKEVLK